MSYTQYETLDGSVKRIDDYTVRILEYGMFRAYPRGGATDCDSAYRIFHKFCKEVGAEMQSSGKLHDATVQLIQGTGTVIASVKFEGRK